MMFLYGCSVDSTWPSASFFTSSNRGPGGGPRGGPPPFSCSVAGDDGAGEGAPRGFTHLCVQRSASAAAAGSSGREPSSSYPNVWGRRESQGPLPAGGAPLPAVLQPPRGPGWGWGALSDSWLFSKGTPLTEATAGDNKQQQRLLQRLKASPLLLVGEVGLLYSRLPAAHLLIAEKTQQPGTDEKREGGREGASCSIGHS